MAVVRRSVWVCLVLSFLSGCGGGSDNHLAAETSGVDSLTRQYLTAMDLFHSAITPHYQAYLSGDRPAEEWVEHESTSSYISSTANCDPDGNNIVDVYRSSCMIAFRDDISGWIASSRHYDPQVKRISFQVDFDIVSDPSQRAWNFELNNTPADASGIATNSLVFSRIDESPITPVCVYVDNQYQDLVAYSTEMAAFEGVTNSPVECSLLTQEAILFLQQWISTR